MNPGTIEIIVSPEGAIRLMTHGFPGESCREASQVFEKALGIVLSDLPTGETITQVQDHQTERS